MMTFLSARPVMLAAILVMPASLTSAAPLALKSIQVELPASDVLFPPGPGAETVNANCLTCHSAGMVLNQPAFKKAVWEAEVKKMIAVYKAPVAEADVATIVAYLAMVKGTD